MRIQSPNIAFGEKSQFREGESLKSVLAERAEHPVRMAKEARHDIAAIRKVLENTKTNQNPCAGKTCHNEVSEVVTKFGAAIRRIFGRNKV